MGFDKHFHEDHCYLDDPADGVGMNVEIIEDNHYQVTQNNVSDQNPVISYIDVSEGTNVIMCDNICEDSTNSSKKALLYLPYSEYCTDHTGYFLHEDEKLVKPGDRFSSHDDFVQYLNENAKRWCFYYKCSDSRKPNTEHETYTYNCVYLRNKEKYKKKGIRKRSNNMKTDCPCKIKLRHLPNERELTVVYVCNHHDHELSIEEFYKLQHGRRLPPYIKEEIMDFLQLKVDTMKIRSYVEMETGFNMSRPFFYALEKNMKSKNVERQITQQRLVMLMEKIAAVEEMYGYNGDGNTDDQMQHIQGHADQSETLKKIKRKRSLKSIERTRRTPPLKRLSNAVDEVISSDDSKRKKLEEYSESAYNNETLQSVKGLQKSVKCEIQRNPWVSDQCVPVLPNRTATNTECEESTLVQTVENSHEDTPSDAQNENETYSYTIQYYNSDDSNGHEIISNEFGEIINDGQENENEENNIENIAYETVVDEVVTENETEEFVQMYVNNDQTMHEVMKVETNGEIETEEIVQMYVNNDQTMHERMKVETNDENETVNNDLDNTQDMVSIENHVEYIAEDDAVEYIDEICEEKNAQNGLQTANNASSTHPLLPVFDVYMKDGNVTGFVVDNNLISGLKDGADKEIQTEDLILSDSQDLESGDFDGEIIHDITNNKSGDTYTKHEYVHKYNIDKYMVQPHFPKYVETLAKETFMDVLHMFTNIYNEKAMFKITTTQKGKEGNTRIWYITDVPRLKSRRQDQTNRDMLGQHLQSIYILKEKVRMLKKQRRELVSKNKQLEDVALRLVNLV